MRGIAKQRDAAPIPRVDRIPITEIVEAKVLSFVARAMARNPSSSTAPIRSTTTRGLRVPSGTSSAGSEMYQ